MGKSIETETTTIESIEEEWIEFAINSLKKGLIVPYSCPPPERVRKSKYTKLCRKKVGKDIWICYPHDLIFIYGK